VRAVALDVHRDFCEVAIVAEGRVRSAGRIEARPEALELFGQSLDRRDWVALEVTGNAWEIARILEAHVARVIVVSPSDTGIRQARAKTDRLDARALAKLLWAGELDSVWTPDERIRAMRRRLARRAQLVRARSRAKNEIHAVLMRCLKDRPPASDLFGVKGRRWLAEQQLPVTERETVDSAMRQVSFLDAEIVEVEQLIAAEALSWPEVKRLMTVPGVNVIVAATFVAAVGDIRRFPDRRKLTAYLGLDPRVRQSGASPATHGHISKQAACDLQPAVGQRARLGRSVRRHAATKTLPCGAMAASSRHCVDRHRASRSRSVVPPEGSGPCVRQPGTQWVPEVSRRSGRYGLRRRRDPPLRSVPSACSGVPAMAGPPW
jgi:transposase